MASGGSGADGQEVRDLSILCLLKLASASQSQRLLTKLTVAITADMR